MSDLYADLLCLRQKFIELKPSTGFYRRAMSGPFKDAVGQIDGYLNGDELVSDAQLQELQNRYDQLVSNPI
jgi:hypothetical protein